MKGTDIKGLTVSSQATNAAGGTVADLLLDLMERKVLALQLRVPNVDQPYVLPVDAVASIGTRGVEVTPDAAPVPLDDARAYVTKPTLNSILLEQVLTETGRNLGKLQDIEVDTAKWAITGYLVAEPQTEFDRGPVSIDATRVVPGEQMLLVSEEGVPTPGGIL